MLLSAGIFAQKYDFGAGATEPGYIKVTPTTSYSASQGYGFESGAKITAVSRSGSDVLRDDYCTSTTEFKFSLKLPLGNYTVTVYLGDKNASSITSVYGEQRRLFIDRQSLAAGQFVAKTFTINRRDYKNGSVTISRTSREQTYVDFDDRLTFFFKGSKPAVCGIDVEKAPSTVTTIYLCGNSTMVNQPSEPYCCWPQVFTRMCNQKVSIADYAESGLTASSFLAQHRLEMIATVIKPGDFLFVEFGHNDQKNSTDVANYASNLKKYRDLAIAHQATPIYVTPTARKSENDPTTSVGGLAQKMRDAAVAQNVKFIELNKGVIELHQSIGSANVQSLYATGDATHFSDYGSFELAQVVVNEINRLNLSIVEGLNHELPVFNTAKPDPLNYFSAQTVKTIEPETSYEVRKKNMSGNGLKVNMLTNTIHFNSGLAGQAIFSIYSLNGKLCAVKKVALNYSQTSLPWVELGKLPRGSYYLDMNIQGYTLGKLNVCKL